MKISYGKICLLLVVFAVGGVGTSNVRANGELEVCKKQVANYSLLIKDQVDMYTIRKKKILKAELSLSEEELSNLWNEASNHPEAKALAHEAVHMAIANTYEEKKEGIKTMDQCEALLDKKTRFGEVATRYIDVVFEKAKSIEHSE